MTGHVYKKKRPADTEDGQRPPPGGDEEERVIMREGDGSSSSCGSDVGSSASAAGRTDSQTPPRFLSPGAGRARQRVDRALHSTNCHVLIVSLVVAHLLVAIAGLLVDLRIFKLSGEHNYLVGNVLSVASCCFLLLFIAEMVVKVCVWQMRFFKHRMDVFDAGVVLLVLALTLAYIGKNPVVTGAGLLIMLRLWRVSKVLNGMVAAVKAEAEKRVTKERFCRKALEREVSKLREYCLQQECELQMYRVMLQQHDIPQPMTIRPYQHPHTLSVIAEVNETTVNGDSDADQPPEYSESPPGIESVYQKGGSSSSSNTSSQHSPPAKIDGAKNVQTTTATISTSTKTPPPPTTTTTASTKTPTTITTTPTVPAATAADYSLPLYDAATHGSKNDQK